MIKLIKIFLSSLSGSWEEHFYIVKKCKNCRSKIRYPKNRGSIKVTCPICDESFSFKPVTSHKKTMYYFLIVILSLLWSFFVARTYILTELIDFYLFFIIPTGAFLYGLIVTAGFIFVLSIFRYININFSKSTIIKTAGILAIFTFWLSNFFYYQDTLGNIFDLFRIVARIYSQSNINFFGVFGGVPIPLSTSSPITYNTGIGFFGFILLIIDHIGLFFSLPFLWLVNGNAGYHGIFFY